MNETLAFAEIRSGFETEWALVEDPEVDEQPQVGRGRVVFHRPRAGDRRER